MKAFTTIALISLLLALGLAACSAAPSPVAVVFEARSGYDAGPLNGMEAYSQIVRCPQPAGTMCSQQSVVDSMRKGDASAKAALDAAEDTVRNQPTVDSSFVIAAMQNAIKAVVAIMTTYSIPIPATNTTATVN